MIELSYPWWLLALPLPWLIYRFVPPFRLSKPGLFVPFFADLAKLSGDKPAAGASVVQPGRWQRALLVVSWLALVLALCKPTWYGEPIVRETSGRDLMVAVDLSGSMAAEDFSGEDGVQLSRLAAVKQVLREFAAERTGDRLGLILFADAPYLQTPFTLDHATWLELLDETQIGMAGQSTRFGDAIGLAIKLFQGAENTNRVLIVLTDGNDTDSLVPPVEAAKIAAGYGIKIYPIAVGDPQTQGEQALDLEVLEVVARTTGGQVFQALDPVQLRQAHDTIADLETQLYDQQTFRPKQSLHHYPLIAAVSLQLLFFVVSSLRARGRRD